MRKLMLLLAFLVCAAPAWAQRALPSDAKRGQLGDPQMLPMLHIRPAVQFNFETMRLAPGGVIIDANNRAITHGRLVPPAEILYTLDAGGNVTRIIVLTPEEQARLDRAK